MSVRLDTITRGWAVLTGAEAVRLVLGLVASLVIARALGPEMFGVYAVLAAAVGHRRRAGRRRAEPGGGAAHGADLAALERRDA